MDEPRADHRIPWLLGAIVLLGLGLRLASAQGGLWLDEAWSAVLADEVGTPLGIFLSINHDNNHHLNSLWLQLVGLGVIVAGILALSLDRRASVTAWPLWAMALPLLAAAIRGLIQPATKFGLGYWPNPSAAVLIGYIVSAATVLLVSRLRRISLPSRSDRRGLAWFALVGLANATAVLLMYAALARGPVALVSPLIATYPLVTLVLRRLVLREVVLGSQAVIGVVVTVAGVVLLVVA